MVAVVTSVCFRLLPVNQVWLGHANKTGDGFSICLLSEICIGKHAQIKFPPNTLLVSTLQIWYLGHFRNYDVMTVIVDDTRIRGKRINMTDTGSGACAHLLLHLK